LILRSASGEVLDEYPLKKLEMSIGRVTTSDIALLRDKLTSRRHATVRYENGRYVLRDERSANGTFVNGRQLTELTPHLLQNGDRIGIGEHELVFWEYSSQAAAVEDLPTLPGPLNFSEATYSTRSDASATLPATSDEFDTQVMDNGASDGTFAAPQPTAAKAEYGAAQPTHDSAQPAAAPAQPQVPIPATISYNVSASPPAPPATSAPPTTPTAGTNTAGAPTPVKPDVPRTDANVTLSRLTSIALPPLPDLTTLMAAVSTLDHQVATLQEQFHTTQEAMRSHDAEIAQVISQLRTGVQRVADRMDSTIAGVARKREKVAWPELSQLIQDVIDNPRDIEYVVKLAQKARALKEIIETYQNVVQTMAECNSLLRSMIGQDR
jgi:predicted component of type VI protein secretion system